MNPIFDSSGKTVAWRRGTVIFGLDGDAVAFLDKKNVVSYSGIHLGFLNRGYFRDHHGNAVAFLENPSPGPELPVPQPPPEPPVLSIPPLRPVPPFPPVPALASLHWSDLTWGDFIFPCPAGREK